MTTVLVLVVFAVLLGGAACIAIAAPGRRAAVPGRVAVLVLIGLVVGELVSMLALSGPIDERLRSDADRAAVSAPAVRAAQDELDAATATRTALDATVTEATTRRDEALVVARCEYRPAPTCPPTTITGVPGQGPETRTANERLAAAQTDLDRATAARAARTPAADAQVTRARSELRSARDEVVAAEPGVGARWMAMNRLSAGATALRLAIDLVVIALALLPLLLRAWRGETARDVRHRQRLESERIAAAAQLAIDRAAQERRVELALAAERPAALPTSASAGAAALEAAGFEPVGISARRFVQETTVQERPAMNDDFLPIAAAAEAASLRKPAGAPAQPQPDDSPTGRIPVVEQTDAQQDNAQPDEPEEASVPDSANLPAVAAHAVPAASSAPAMPEQRKPNPFVPPVLDDAARTIVGFVRPLMPPFVAGFLPGSGGTRTVQQSYEEVEEVTFSMRRTRKVTVGTTEQDLPVHQADGAAPADHSVPQHFPRHAQSVEPLDVAHEEIPAYRYDPARDELAARERRGLPGQRPRELGQSE